SREESPAAQDESEKIVDNSAKTSPSQQSRPTNKGQKNKTSYSPAIMNLANEHNLDLTNINVTVAGGRITRKDVEKYLSGDCRRNLDTPRDPEPEIPAPSDVETGDKEIPLTGVRKVMSDNMVRASKKIPHACMTVDVDITDLVRNRDKIKDS